MVKKILHIFLFNVVSKLFVMATTVILIRTLDTKEYSLFVNFQAVYSFLGMFLFSAFNYSLVRYSAEYRSIYNSYPIALCKFVIFLQILIYGILAIILLYNYERLTYLLFSKKLEFQRPFILGIFAGFSLMLSNISFFILQSQENFKIYNIANVLRPLLIFVFISISFIFHVITLENIAVAIIISQLVFACIFLYLIFRSKNIKYSYDINAASFFEYLGENKFLILYFIFLELFSQFDIFILSKYSSEYELSNYGVAFKYYSVGLLLLGSIHAVLLPKMSREAKSGALKQKLFALEWIKKSCIIGFIIFIAYFLCRNIYIHINGYNYLYSYYILFIFCFSILQGLVFSPLVNIIIANKDYGFLSSIALIAISFNCIFNLLVVKDYGAIGVAVVTTITHTIINVSSFFRILYKNKALSV